MPEPHPSFVIVNYRSARLTAACVESIYESLGEGPTEIVVVDNASGEADLEVLRAIEGIHRVENPENVGFGAACNQGIERTGGELVWLMNPDARLTVEAGYDVPRAFEFEPRLAAASPPLLDAERRPQRTAQTDPSPATYWRHYSLFSDFRGGGDMRPIPPALGEGNRDAPGLIEADWLIGAALCLRRSALDELEGPAFDPRYFLYFEDADLCRRLRAAGWKVALVECPPAEHAAQQISGADPETKRATLEHFFRSFLAYAERWFDAAERAALRRQIRWDMRLRLLTLPLRRLPRADRAARREAYRAILRLAEEGD